MLRCPRSIVIFGLACCLAASGCQMLDVETAVEETALVPPAEPEFPPELIALLEAVEWQRTSPSRGKATHVITPTALADRAQQRRYHAVVLSDRSDPTAPRKKHETDKATASAEVTASGEKQSEEDPSTAADKSSPESPDEDQATGDDAMVDDGDDGKAEGGDADAGREEQLADIPLAELQRVAATGTLAGWNAAILIAYRAPDQATASLPVLERLVSDPPVRVVRPEVADPTGDSDPDAPESPTETATESREETQHSDPKPSDTGLPEAARLAAAEAWCLVLSRIGESPLESLTPAARLMEGSQVPEEVQRELLLAIARSVEPAKIPGMAERFPDSVRRDAVSVEDRRAAIEACVIHALHRGKPSAESRDADSGEEQNPTAEAVVSGAAGVPKSGAGKPGAGESPGDTQSAGPVFDAAIWPPEIWNCQMDRDPVVRQQFGLWLVLAGHERAFALLRTQVTDVNAGVSAGAMHAIGLLGTQASTDWLRKQAQARQSRSRIAAIRALAESAGPAEVAPFGDDDSPMVRRVVADILTSKPSARAVLMMRPLLLDADPHVAEAAMSASAAWPDEFAIPLWLTGMRDSLMPGVRQRCFELIRGRRAVSEPFLVTASLPEREQMIEAMIERYDLPAGILSELRQGGLREPAARSPRRDAEIRGDLQILLSAGPRTPEYATAVQRLTSLQPADVPLIEQELASAPDAGRTLVLREILPELSPVYQALHNLGDADVIARRRAAGKLAVLAESGTLSPVATRELHGLLTHEADSLVWRFSMAAVMPDGTRESAPIAQLALHHRWPDIRILGCQYVGRHGQPEQAPWLLPLLTDDSRNVRLAAIEAAGKCQHPILISGVRHGPDGDPLPGLLSLLTSAHPGERFAVSVSLARLGDERGMQELIRRSYERNPKARAEVIRAMGQTGRRALLPHLMELAWTEEEITVQRAILHSFEQLVPPGERPQELSTVRSYQERVRVWRRWWELRTSTAASASGPSRPRGTPY